MGRNADKRKARKAGTDPAETASSPGAPAVADDDVDASAPIADQGPRSLAGDLLIGADSPVDGSMARALFKLTCLLAVRGRDGVPRENLARVAQEVAGIIEADTVSLMRLETGDDVVPSRLVLLGAHGLAAADEGLVTF